MRRRTLAKGRRELVTIKILLRREKIQYPRCVDVNPRKLNVIENRTQCTGIECQMSVRPYQTTFHRFSQCCICRTNDNSVDLENDIRHDVPSYQKPINMKSPAHILSYRFASSRGGIVERRTRSFMHSPTH